MKKLIIFSLVLIVFPHILVAAVINIKQGHYDSVNDIVNYPISNIVITCSSDETIIIWDTEKNEIINTIELYKGVLTSIAVSPHGQYFVVGSKNGEVFIFDFNTRKLIKALKLHSGKTNAIVFSTKENVFISAGNDGTIVVYDIEERTIIKGINMPSRIISLAISPNKKLIAAGDAQGNIYLIPSDNYTSFSAYKNNSNWVSGIIFSPDNQFVASIDWDFTLSLYSVITDKLVQKTKIFSEKPLNSITWSDDNKYIAVASSDCNIYILNSFDLSLLCELKGHKKAVLKAIFKGDSSIIMSVSSDSTIKTWDISNPESPQLIKSYSGY